MIAAAVQPNSPNEIAFCEFFGKRSKGAEPDADLTNALTACLSAGVEVVSVLPDRVELRVPSDLVVISPLQELVTQLGAGLSLQVAEAISRAFQEMLCNAVEHGGHLDPTAVLEVRLRRLKHAFVCRIKDPGDGFEPSSLDHAAINNPKGNSIRHALVREEKGLRGGGYGILLATQIVDHLVYNQRHNEVLFVKYLS